MSNALKKNSSFVQLSDPSGIKAMRILMLESPTAANVFFLFMQHMDKSNCLIASMETIGSKLGLGRSTVYRAIKYLKENLYIAVYKSGSTNVYTLNADIVWKDRGDKKMEALLCAKVLLSLDEQDDDVQKNVSVKNKIEVIK